MRQILFVSLLLLVFLSGCSTLTISKVDRAFENCGRQYTHDVVKSGDNTTHYYFVYYGEGGGLPGLRSSGWYCWEYTVDTRGVVIQRKEYWVGNNRALDEFRQKIKQK